MAQPTVRLHDDLDEWVREQSSERSVSMAQIVRDCVRAAASSDGPYSRETHSDDSVADRLDALEQRVTELERAGSGPDRAATEPDDSDGAGRTGPERADEKPTDSDGTGRNGPDRAAEESDSDPDRAAPGRPEDNEAGHTGPERAGGGFRDEIEAALEAGEYAAKANRVQALVAVARELRDAGTLTSPVIEQQLEEEGVTLSTRGQMWSETARDVPFIETKRGSNEYEWTGDSE